MLTAASDPAAMSRPPRRALRRVVNQSAPSAHRNQMGRMLGRPSPATVAKWASLRSARNASSSSRSSGIRGLLLDLVALDEQQAERSREVGQVVGGRLRRVTPHVGLEVVPAVPPQLGHPVVGDLRVPRRARHHMDHVPLQPGVPVARDRRVRVQPVLEEVLARHVFLLPHPDVHAVHEPPSAALSSHPRRGRRRGVARPSGPQTVTSDRWTRRTATPAATAMAATSPTRPAILEGSANGKKLSLHMYVGPTLIAPPWKPIHPATQYARVYRATARNPARMSDATTNAKPRKKAPRVLRVIAAARVPSVANAAMARSDRAIGPPDIRSTSVQDAPDAGTW